MISAKQEKIIMKEFIKKNQQILMVALVWIIGLGGLYSLNQYNTNQISAYYAKRVQIKRQAKRVQIKRQKARKGQSTPD